MCHSLPPEVVASKYSAVNTTDDYLMLHTVCELIINVIAYGTNTNESGLLSVSRIRLTGCGFSEDAPLDPEWGVVCARPRRCTVSDEHSNRELQPQHSLAIVRIHHPGQRLNSGGAGLHVQTCKPVYEQPPAAVSFRERRRTK